MCLTNQKRDFKPFYASPTVGNSGQIIRLLGRRLYKLDSMLFKSKKMTHLAEKKEYFTESEKNGFN